VGIGAREVDTERSIEALLSVVKKSLLQAKKQGINQLMLTS
jgi:hypothetical protein